MSAKWSTKCFLPAWLFGWVAAIFVPSATIPYFGRSKAAAAIGTGFDRFPATAWQAADDMGPAAKLMLAGLTAMAATLLALPAAYSLGFGVGLSGVRLDPALLPHYAVGAVLAGVVFELGIACCARERGE